MGNAFNLSQSDKLRLELDKQQREQISKLYKNVSDKIAHEAKKYEGRTNISSILRTQYIQQMQKEIGMALEENQQLIEGVIADHMEQVTQLVVDANDKWMEALGLPQSASLLNIPREAVESVISGQLYEGDWSLSSAIWSDIKNQQSEINEIVATGIANNSSAYEIAKDLEKYVDPNATKEWDWNKVYPNSRKKIDYNAQRLARTMVSHAYQKALVDTTKPNPFVGGIKWRSAHSTRTCSLCNERDGKVYKKDELPLDHPNGLCTFIAVTPPMNDVADRLAGWVKGDSDPQLDNWAKQLKVCKDDVVRGKEDRKDGLSPVFNIDAYSAERRRKAFRPSSPQEADSAYKGVAGKLFPKAPKEEKDALYNYTSASGPMNRPLRGIAKKRGGKMEFKGVGNVDWNAEKKTGKADIDAFTKYISKSSYPFDTHVLRGVDVQGSAPFLGVSENDLQEIMKGGANKQKIIDNLTGSVHKDEAFLSTGIAEGKQWRRDVTFNIYAPQGTHMAYVEPMSSFSGRKKANRIPIGKQWTPKFDERTPNYSIGMEAEMTIQRGTTYKVSNVVVNENGTLSIDLDVVAQDY